jgi:hypothetical protein
MAVAKPIMEEPKKLRSRKNLQKMLQAKDIKMNTLSAKYLEFTDAKFKNGF